MNQDTLKTKEKCIKACEESVKMGKSVVIDNTNPNRDTRASYIRIANEHSIQARCFHFVASREICNHNNHFRSETGDRKRLPDIAFNSFSSRFEEPCAETEGLVEVKQISFVPSFENEEMKEQWAKFFV